jgi:putative membrane protein
MKSSIVYICSFVIFLIAMSCDNNNTHDSKDLAKEQNDKKFDSTDIENDTKFAVNAADGGLMEVELGKLALTNASSQQVKDFGQQMVNDHSAGNDELKAIAQRKNISLPASLSESKQKKVNDMAKKKGADFDKAYVDMMVKDHEDDISEFKKEADKGNDTEIKNWAAGKVAVLQHHLDMAKSANDAVKNK